MAAPTTAFTDNSTGTITTTGEADGLLLTVNRNMNRAKLGFRGTFTGTTVAVRGHQAGLSATSYYPIPGVDVSTGQALSNSSSTALTNSTNAALEYDTTGCDYIEVWASAGTLTDFNIDASQSLSNVNDPPLLVQVVTGATSHSANVDLLDNVLLEFGTGDDITMTWDGTNFIVGQAAANSQIQWGASGAGIDHVFYGDTATYNMTWDQSADSLLFNDNAKLAIGTGSDVVFSWDATRLNVTQAAVNSEIRWGIDGAGIDQMWYGDTASTFMNWDQSADSLIFADNAKVVFGTGSDITFLWDATDLLVSQGTADSSIKWGVSGAGINHVFYGDTATYNMTWDQTNDQLLFADNAKLAIGAGGGAAGDITFSWNATKMLVAQLTANSAIDWGVDGAGIDQVWYADTASSNVTWDQSADSMIFNGVARLVWTGTTGQSEMHLTDNLADALSIEISGSTDLMVFTTTDNAESVAIRGLRKTQTTAVAITGATVLTLADSGGIFTVDQGSAYDIDLPSPTTGQGCEYFFSLTAPGANNVTITVTGSAATFVGSIISEGQIIVATGSTLTFASGVSLLGDSICIRAIATNLYHVVATASALNGITVA